MKKFTEKDLAYVTDMFSWNSNALKLTNHFLEELEGKGNHDVIEILEEIFELHYQNLHKCINILDGTDFFQMEEEYEEYEEYEEEEEEDENE